MKRALLFAFLFCITGCMVGPDYKRPSLCLEKNFSEERESTEGNDSDFCQWWKELQDPFLDSLLEEAVTANYDYRIALEKIQQARALYSLQRSQLFPEVDLDGSASRLRNSQNVTNSSSFGPPVQNFFQLGFDTIWELDFFGKFRRASRATYAEWEASKEDAEFILLSTLSEVARTYVDICSFQQQISLLTQKIQADTEEWSLGKDLYQSGFDSDIPVEALRASLDQEQASLSLLETSMKQAIYALALLLGRQPEGFAEAFQEIRSIPNGLHKIPVGLPSDLLRRRPDIKSAERQLAAATERIGVAVADLFPHISLTGSNYSFASNSQRNLFQAASRTWSFGPSIQWDILDFGKTRSAIAIQNSLQQQALLFYEQSVIAALQEVEQTLVAYFNEQERRVLLGDERDANYQSFLLTQDLFQSGFASESQVLETKKTFLDSEIALMQSERALTDNLIAVYKALGGNWECSSTH